MVVCLLYTASDVYEYQDILYVVELYDHTFLKCRIQCECLKYSRSLATWYLPTRRWLLGLVRARGLHVGLSFSALNKTSRTAMKHLASFLAACYFCEVITLIISPRQVHSTNPVDPAIILHAYSKLVLQDHCTFLTCCGLLS